MAIDKQQGIEWLAAIERELGYSPSKVARAAGMSPTTLTRPNNPESEYVLTQNSVARVIEWMAGLGNFRADLRPAIQTLSIHGWRLTGRKAAAPEWNDAPVSHEKVKRQPLNIMRRSPEIGSSTMAEVVGDRGREADLPLIGTAAGSLMGSMRLQEPEQPRHVHRPPGLAHCSRAYALLITGNSMAPKYVDGDLVFVDPDKRVDPGDTIIIQTRNFNKNNDQPTQAYIKTFRGLMDSKLYAEQLNPPAKIDFNMGQKDGGEIVYAFHRVLTNREMFGV